MLEPGYDRMAYAPCGRTGLVISKIALGGWHNFADLGRARALAATAIELGIIHIDLANNYGPPPGSAEQNFGRLLASDFKGLRDQLVISTKAGYPMWPGPLGQGSSRKHLLASLDQSLARLGLDYVDIFYSHRYDPATPLEETIGALAHAVRAGKALHAALSNYPADALSQAVSLARSAGLPLVLHQCRYSLLDRSIERGVIQTGHDAGLGFIAFSPLAQGLLAGRYSGPDPLPPDSRAASGGFLTPDEITPQLREKLAAFDALARARGVTPARLALACLLRDPRVTSVLIGASRPEQIIDCARAASDPAPAPSDLKEIERLFGK